MDLTKANQPRFQATDSDGKPMWQVYARILPAGQLCPEGGAQRVNGLLRGYRAYPKGNDRPQMRGGR